MIIISNNAFFIQYLLFVNNVWEMNIFRINDKQKGGQLL